jgi:drug/metabolite transporter (DMT)-like permease
VLIVLFSPLALPGYRLRANHLLGVAIGCAGVVLAVGYGHIHPTLRDLPAYGLAAGGAVLWALYSLALKRLPPVASTSMGGSLLGAGVICSALIWTLPGPSLALPTTLQWSSLAALAIGPTAVAYITWDLAMKRGDPRIVASIMNLGPLTSTLLIIVINHQPMTWPLMLGAVIVVIGSFIGCLEMFQRYFQHPPRLPATDAVPAADPAAPARPVADLVA